MRAPVELQTSGWRVSETMVTLPYREVRIEQRALRLNSGVLRQYLLWHLQPLQPGPALLGILHGPEIRPFLVVGPMLGCSAGRNRTPHHLCQCKAKRFGSA